MAWSYTALTGFETCPKRYFLTRVAKIVHEPPSPALKIGNDLHKAFENYFRGGEKLQVTEQVRQFAPLLERLKDSRGEKFPELRVALTRALTPCGFFDPQCWYRGVIDLAIDYGNTAVLFDFKTGKVKEDFDQLSLFAAAWEKSHPDVERIDTAFLWVAAGKISKASFSREDAEAVWEAFAPRVARLEYALETETFPPKPSGLCRGWCPVGQAHCTFCTPGGK
jgi:hypothetical protein